jgi:hypothetical protein
MEIDRSPERVRDWVNDFAQMVENVYIDDQALRLHDAYLRAGILGERWTDDAMHVALATAGRCDMIVSWNFRHIVHSDKMPLYNAVNVLEGFRPLAIHSPAEVVLYEEEEV